MRTRNQRKKLRKRSRELGRAASAGARLGADLRQIVRLRNSARWYSTRARAMGMRRDVVVAACQGRWRRIGCGCGDAVVPVGCDQPQLCPVCRRKHWARWNRRLAKGLDVHTRAAIGAWSRAGRRGMKPGVYLVTLTAPHSGDLEIDRAALGAGWRKLYKVANRRGWWDHYAATYETTAGASGEGHVHLHVAVISSWIPYADLHVAWRAAMPGALVLDVQAPRRSNSHGAAAKYLASYVTKGVDVAEFTGEKAAELLVAFRGKRKVTTSSHFYRPPRRPCPVCGQTHRTLEMPQSFFRHALGRAFKARAMWWGAPEPPQKHLAFAEI